MIFLPPIVLVDSGGQSWRLTCTDAGVARTIATTLTGQSSLLILDSVAVTVWTLSVSLGGGSLLVAPSASSTTIKQFPVYSTPGGALWGIQISNGMLQFVPTSLPTPPTGASCSVPYVFDDGVGNFWQLGVTTLGQLTFTLLLTPPVSAWTAYPMLDTPSGLAFSFSAVPGPFFSIKRAAAFDGAVKANIQLVDANKAVWELRLINAGGYQVTKVGTSLGGDPQVGTLDNYDTANPSLIAGRPGGWLPAYYQPGGPGTTTYPQQGQGSSSDITGVPMEVGLGMWTAGCGHWFNHWEVISATVGCVQSAIVRCPLCQYIQRIISPFSAIYQQQNEFIIA